MVWNRGQGWGIWRSVYTLYSLEGSIWMPSGHMMADVLCMQFARARVCAHALWALEASPVSFCEHILCVGVWIGGFSLSVFTGGCWERDSVNISQALWVAAICFIFSFDHRMTSMSLALARSQIKSFVLFTRRLQDDNIFISRCGDVSLPRLSVNWGQVISVTVVNVLSADKVMLTFLERKAQI